MFRAKPWTRDLVTAGALGALALGAAASAQADTLAYDTVSRVVTITLTVSAPYVEIAANSNGDYQVKNFNDFTSVSVACTASLPNYGCGTAGAPVTKTIVKGTPGVDTVIGLTHVNGALSNYNPPMQLSLGAGDDVVQAGDGDDVIDVGDGDDSVTNYLGNDRVEGGAGDDRLVGGRNADTLLGGDGADQLDGGLGADVLQGGSGFDSVSYAARTAAVSVSLDGQANDGEAGEGDNVPSDAERVVTGSGSDTVTGSAGFTEFVTGDGNDTVDPGGGVDVVDAGAGNDTVQARDGVDDHIDCGDGADGLVGDAGDEAVGCEALQLSAIAAPGPGLGSGAQASGDADGDRVLAPLDCDDQNPARRPGLIDVPGNGVDEDCSGADAAYQRVATVVQPRFKTRAGKTTVPDLTLFSLPAGATAELSCQGGAKRGCFAGTLRRRFAKAADRAQMAGLLNRRSFKAGAVLVLRITAPAQVGRITSYTMRSGHTGPKAQQRCLVPGAAKPSACS